jgi:hypothetical protein
LNGEFHPDDLGGFAADIYEELRPLTWEEEKHEFALAKFVGSIGELFQGVETLVRDTDDFVGWGSVMDPEAAPSDWLGWLGQFVGTRLDQRQRLVQYVNLVDNPSVEHQSVLWFTNQSTAGVTVEQAPVRSTVWSKIRPSSLYFRISNPDGTTRSIIVGTPTTDRMPVVEGETYFAAAEANVAQFPAGGPPNLRISWYNAGGSVISTVDSASLGVGESRPTISAVAPALAVSAIVTFMAVANATNERLEAYLDNWEFVQTEDTIQFYFDGALPSSQWTGTAEASTSEFLELESEDVYFERQRQLIKDHVGFERGSPQGMLDAVKAYLTGTKTVFFFERDTSPYHFRISTFTEETPNPAKVEEILRSYKPAGLVMVYSLVGGSDWTTELGVHATWTALSAAHANWEHVYTTGH